MNAVSKQYIILDKKKMTQSQEKKMTQSQENKESNDKVREYWISA